MEPTDVPPYFWTINTPRRYTPGAPWYSPAVSDAPLLALTTLPSAEAAATVARVLVEEQLAACVNLVPGVRSIYRWQGAVVDDAEVLCLIKTSRDRLAALTARLIALHPYEVPELVTLPVDGGHAPYLAWVLASVTPGA